MDCTRCTKNSPLSCSRGFLTCCYFTALNDSLLLSTLVYLFLFSLKWDLHVLDFSSQRISEIACREGAALTPPLESLTFLVPTLASLLANSGSWGGAQQLFNSVYHRLHFSVGRKVEMITILIERAWETLRKQNIIIQTGNCQVVPILEGSSSDHRGWSGPQFKVSAQVCIKLFYIKSINMYVLTIIFEILVVWCLHFFYKHWCCLYSLDTETENYLRDTIQFLLINSSLLHWVKHV